MYLRSKRGLVRGMKGVVELLKRLLFTPQSNSWRFLSTVSIAV